jgi:hypothetical protein
VLEHGAWPAHIPHRLASSGLSSRRFVPVGAPFMRRIAQTCLCLALSGCGYSTWADLPFTTGTNPHMPVNSSENMRRAMGEVVEVQPLATEPGDVWPGPLAPEPTLEDIEKQGLQPQAEQPVPGSPEFRNQQPPYLPPPPATRGSSTPPGNTQQGLAPLPAPRPPQASVPTPPARNPAGQVYPTLNGPAVTNGGTTGYQTTTTPGGGSAIVVPNGNGTSTIIHSNGTIETVPTPH